MGVEQGYSKIATSGLVFAYDTGDTVNSYIGEPTTNLANFNIASSGFGSDTSGNLTQTSNSSEATYRGRLSRKMVVGAGYWNAYVFDYNTGVSSAVFAVSYKVKTADGSHPNTIIGGGYIYGSAGSFFPTPTFTYLSDGWYLATMLYAGSSMVLNSLTGMNGSGGPKTFYIIDYQAEAKTHSTPFAGVAGTRSNTQGLLDISGGGSSINLASVSFNSNAMMNFDGTDDTVSIPSNSSNNVSGNITMELILRRGAASAAAVMHKEVQYTLYITAGGAISYADSSYWSYSGFGYHGNVTTDTYHHLVATKSGSLVTIYLDGNTVISQNFGSAISQTNNTLYIGSYNGGSNYFNGYIPVSKVYSKALTANEILGNFNHYKTRFNIT